MTNNIILQYTRIYDHESLHQTKLDQSGNTSPYRPPSNPSKQGGDKKCERVQYHQDKYASGSCISHVQNLQAEIGTVRKTQTRRITQVNEEPQEHDLWDRNYVRVRKNQIYTYYATWINLRKFDYLAIQVLSTTNAHMNVIKESLLEYFPQPMHFPTRSA